MFPQLLLLSLEVVILNFQHLKMSNKGVIVERVLDGDVPDGKNLVTKEGFKIQSLQNWYSSLSSEIKNIFIFQ